MTTKREGIIAAIATSLASTAGVSGRVYRSRVEPLSRGEAPALILEPVRDTCEQNTSLPTLDWSLTLQITVIVRQNPPDQVADSIIESMHSKMMSDLTVGGRAVDVQPLSTSYESVPADQISGLAVSTFLIRYRTTAASLAS